MKFFVISKPHSAVFQHAELEQVKKQQQSIEKLKSDGILDECYTILSGGTVYILNAESYITLHHMVRNSNLGLLNEISIFPIAQQA